MLPANGLEIRSTAIRHGWTGDKNTLCGGKGSENVFRAEKKQVLLSSTFKSIGSSVRSGAASDWCGCEGRSPVLSKLMAESLSPVIVKLSRALCVKDMCVQNPIISSETEALSERCVTCIGAS
jgi:hypothetical protein